MDDLTAAREWLTEDLVAARSANPDVASFLISDAELDDWSAYRVACAIQSAWSSGRRISACAERAVSNRLFGVLHF